MQWMNKFEYNVEEYNVDEVSFPSQKPLHIFCMIYNFAVTITRIHFAICEVQSNNLNPSAPLRVSIRNTTFPYIYT